MVRAAAAVIVGGVLEVAGVAAVAEVVGRGDDGNSSSRLSPYGSNPFRAGKLAAAAAVAANSASDADLDDLGCSGGGREGGGVDQIGMD